MTNSMRILFWNIMHGGGYRAGKIADQILDWNPDIVALAEFRGTAPSRSIAQRLYDAGYVHQLTTANSDEPTWNALLVASRIELTRVHVEEAPEPDLYWLLAKVHCGALICVGTMLVPLGDAWYEYTGALLNIASGWQQGPCLIIGDTNCGLTGLDEDTASSADAREKFIEPMSNLGWSDMYRVFHPDLDAPTWYSHIKCGFRLDRAYASPGLQPLVVGCRHDWGHLWNQKKLSDHAAIILDLELPD